MTSTDKWNAMRFTASEIIIEMYEAEKAGQLLLLKIQLDAALKKLTEPPATGRGKSNTREMG